MSSSPSVCGAWLHYEGRVLVTSRLARVLWLQGKADQARLMAEANVEDARTLGRSLSICLALGEAACPNHAGFVADLAEGLANAGRVEEARAIVDEALARSNSSGVGWHVAELLRLGGELQLGRTGGPASPEGMRLLRSSLQIARRQGALFWELRTAVALARTAACDGDDRQAGHLLRNVYDRVTEGFETPDAAAAKDLLAAIPGRRCGAEC